MFSYAQLTNQDCLNAIPVCQNTYVQPNSYVGAGSDTSEINSALSCLNAGERNDVWYIFTVSVSGTLNFSIFPNNPNNDYDFALFNISNLGCNQIRDSANMEVACNFSANIPGCGGITGANGNTTGACALMNDNTVAVTAGQTYVLNVSNYSQTQQNGYTLDFSASSATIFDNIPPLLNTISALACGADTLNLVFNENMLFSSFQPSDFTLTGPGGSYSITSITAPNCTNGSAYDKNYRFTFSPAITIGGTYTFSIVGNVTDICSNPIATPTTRTLNVAGITVNPSSTSVSCNGGNDGTATVNIITGTGPFSYQWSNNVSTTNTASNLPVGIYVVTVSAPNSCPATATYNITQAPSMTDSALVITPATCGANNGALNLFVTGGNSPYSYLWSNGSTSLSQSSLAAGNYTLTVTDNKNCTFSKMFTVGTLSTLNSVPQIQNINCFGDNTGSITLNTTGGSGNYTFQWAGGISNTNSVSNLTAGTYTATVMDGACLIVFNNLTITQPSLPLTATISSTQTTCGNTDGTATITNATGGSSPYSYSWNTGSTSMSISNLASGTYTCTVTDVNGCTVVKTTTVSPSNGHSVTISYLNDTVTCFGWSDGGVSLNVSGGVTPYAYQWSGGLPPNSSQNSLAAGTYTATVTDATGCSVTVSATIESAPAINLNLVNSTNVLCYGSNTGTASVSASGGTGTLTYIWIPSGGTNASATNLAAGGYTVTVTDAKGCNASLPVTITQPAAAFTNVNVVTQTFCGNNNGAISTVASGGTSPFSYLWNNGATSTSISNLALAVTLLQ
ncbi:MAG: SprB repeat-containing protein [Bacteroidetes bacterium]|nr:SprB repeat-containing protein [Bacteroidota bacterium]